MLFYRKTWMKKVEEGERPGMVGNGTMKVLLNQLLHPTMQPASILDFSIMISSK